MINQYKEWKKAITKYLAVNKNLIIYIEHLYSTYLNLGEMERFIKKRMGARRNKKWLSYNQEINWKINLIYLHTHTHTVTHTHSLSFKD